MRVDFKSYLSNNKAALSSKSSKIGGYSFLISIIALAMLIAVNVFANALPAKWTQIDMSATRLYSLTSSSKVVVNNLDQDVTIYWICQAGQEDSVIDKLLQVYDSMSDHLTVVEKDPDKYPTFAAQYTDETVSNNSLIVECGSKSRYIAYSEIYEQDMSSYYSGGSAAQSFDGEGEITTAIDYVVSDDLPQVYVVTGHEESDLSTTLQDALERDNMEIQEFSMLNVDEIPEDADAVLINAPTSDFSEEEVEMLETYIADGGHVIVLSGLQEDEELENLDGLLEAYGVSSVDGLVVEGSRDNYAFSYPYILLPNIQSSEITDALIEENSNVIMPIAQGLTIGDAVEGYTVTSLLDTSDEAFAKADGYNITTYEKEDGDVDGPFSLAVSVECDNSDGKLVWISSDVLMQDEYNSYSSGANADLVMNALSWMAGESDSISIRAKSLDYNYLTISDTASTWIKICLIGLIPAAYFIYGLDEVLRRRKRM